jgi:membrane-anchored protein YejM (alkaline phosphatase superfamily)
VPAYWWTYGWENLLQLCDIAVILTCAGLWYGSPLLLSSQAVSSLVVDILWCADFLVYGLFDLHIVGGTDYMWDQEIPLFTRSLSFFHVLMPIVLLWSLRRVGYDRRGFRLQAAIAVVVLIVSRLMPPFMNLNFAHEDPILGRAWEPALLHLALILAGLIGVVYGITHQILLRLLPPAPK